MRIFELSSIQILSLFPLPLRLCTFASFALKIRIPNDFAPILNYVDIKMHMMLELTQLDNCQSIESIF